MLPSAAPSPRPGPALAGSVRLSSTRGTVINCLLVEATQYGLTLIGVTLGTPGDDITVTGPGRRPRPELGPQPLLSKGGTSCQPRRSTHTLGWA